MDHLLEIRLKEYPRTWTKREWKQCYSYLRTTRRLVESEMYEMEDEIQSHLKDLAVYGTSVLKIKIKGETTP